MTTTAEVLLALRAPGADWLATLVTALDESARDPEFQEVHRALFAELAGQAVRDGGLPPAIVEAAQRRMQDFHARLAADLAAAVQPPAPAPRKQPHLSIVKAG